MSKISVAFTSIHGDPLAPLGGISHGGQNVYVKELARHLVEHGFRVDVFSRWESPDQPAIEAIGPDARVIRVPVGPPQFVPKEHMTRLLPELEQWIIDFARQTGVRYQLVHGHYYESGAIAIQLRKQWQVPFLETFHSLGMVKRHTLGQQDPSPSQRLTIEQQIVEQVDRIVATTPQEKSDLLTYYHADPARISIIPCGVNLDLFQPVPRSLARRHIGVAADRFLLTFVGRMEKRKGIDTLLEAMALLLTQQPTLPLQAILVGGQSKIQEDQAVITAVEAMERNRLQEIIYRRGLTDRVTFTGGLPQDQLRYYYSAGDVTVIPSYYEPFGLTALEALACGSSVIASRVGGLKTTVAQGQVGLQFEPQSPEDLADKIAFLIDNPELNERLQASARPYVERTYSWPAIAARVAAVYREVLGHDQAINTAAGHSPTMKVSC